MKKKITALTLIITILALSLFGCASASSENAESDANETQAASDDTSTASEEDADQDQTITDGGDFVFGLTTEVNDFDPFSSITADTRAINFNIYEGLVKVATDGSFEPAIAEDYEVSDDAKTYTFTIRSGVLFHDGNELTEDDILYSVQKAIDTATSGYDEIDTFGFDDDGKFVITLKEADAGFIAYLTAAIVPADAEDLSSNPIGTGPFKFVEYVEQDHITLEKNEDYWGTAAHLDTVTIKFVADQAELITDFIAGSIDGFTSSSATAVELTGREDTFNQYVANSNAVQLLALNNEFEPFQDERVRQAVSYLVDSDEIIDVVNNGYGKKIGSGLIPALDVYYDDSLEDVYDLDVEKAKELLEEAGYGDGFSFTIKVPSNYTVHVNTAEVIVNELAEAGIEVTIQQVDWATWLDEVYTNRDYEATIISLDGSLAYPTAFLSRYQSDASNNFINYQSDAYDEAYLKATTTIDEEERVTYFKEAQAILNEEAASVYIEDISNIVIYSKEFEGYDDYPLYVTSFSSIYQVSE